MKRWLSSTGLWKSPSAKRNLLLLRHRACHVYVKDYVWLCATERGRDPPPRRSPMSYIPRYWPSRILLNFPNTFPPKKSLLGFKHVWWITGSKSDFSYEKLDQNRMSMILWNPQEKDQSPNLSNTWVIIVLARFQNAFSAAIAIFSEEETDSQGNNN